MPNTITIADKTGAGVTSYPLQLGRPFLLGAIPHFPQLLLDGAPVADPGHVKNRWPDGSVKFAVLAAVVPAIPANGSVAVSFQDQASGNDTPLTVAQMVAPLPNDATMRIDTPATVGGSTSLSLSQWQAISNGSLCVSVDGAPAVCPVIDFTKIVYPTGPGVYGAINQCRDQSDGPPALGISRPRRLLGHHPDHCHRQRSYARRNPAAERHRHHGISGLATGEGHDPARQLDQGKRARHAQCRGLHDPARRSDWANRYVRRRYGSGRLRRGSGGGQRCGRPAQAAAARRDSATGRIVEAYGFDLSPLARYDEFVRIAAAAGIELGRMEALRRRVTLARQAIRQGRRGAGGTRSSPRAMAAARTRGSRAGARWAASADLGGAGPVVKALKRRKIEAEERFGNWSSLWRQTPSGSKADILLQP